MDAYFQQLNTLLKHLGTGMPQLIVDIQSLKQNIHIVKKQLPQNLQPRLVVKSLACMDLLKLCSNELETQRFMLFHFSHLQPLLNAFPQADVLLGKPMPIQVLKQANIHQVQLAVHQIQWLIDSKQRLQQYLDFAQQQQLQLRINIEIDVGLHRGGVSCTEELQQLLEIIRQHPQHLKFAGLMGYDAHVAKIPHIIQSADKTYQQSQQTYQQLKEYVVQQYPTLCDETVCWNGGGSPSFSFHCQRSVCNDISFGSMLLKPADFDLKPLKQLQSALWIATPILKVLPEVRVPQMEWLSRWSNTTRAVFVYGGYWLAKYVYPKGSRPHRLYGRSSNQELVQVPKTSQLSVDDYMFLRPNQSESVIPQFASLYAYDGKQLEAWETFRE